MLAVLLARRWLRALRAHHSAPLSLAPKPVVQVHRGELAGAEAPPPAGNQAGTVCATCLPWHPGAV